jgi:hypothetical protein
VTPTSAARITRVFDVPNPNCDPNPRAPAAGDLVINEIHYDPDPDVPDGDANGDGTRDGTDDEFVEIVNTSTSTLDLSGVMLDDGVQNRHVFAAGTMLGCARPLVIFGGGDPMDPAWQATWVLASGNMLGLNNTTDTVTLLDPNGTMITTVTYPDAGNVDQAITRMTDLDPNAPFIGHTTHPQAGGRFFSPGTRIDGTPF